MSTSSPAVSVRPIAALNAKLRRRHVLSEGDGVPGGSAQECGHGGARLEHAPVDLPRRREIAVGIHVASGVELGDRIDHRTRHLAAAGAVQKRKLRTAPAGSQRREVAPGAQRVLFSECHQSKS